MDKCKSISILNFYKIKYILYSCENIYWKWKKKFIIWFYYIIFFIILKILHHFTYIIFIYYSKIFWIGEWINDVSWESIFILQYKIFKLRSLIKDFMDMILAIEVRSFCLAHQPYKITHPTFFPNASEDNGELHKSMV